MSYIIVTRLPTGELVGIKDGIDNSDCLAEFDTQAEADAAADDTMICRAYGYDLIEIDA